MSWTDKGVEFYIAGQTIAMTQTAFLRGLLGVLIIALLSFVLLTGMIVTIRDLLKGFEK